MRLNHNTMVVGLHSALQQENGLRMQLEQTLRLRDADLLQHSQSQSQAASQHLIMSNSLLGQLTASCNREAYSLHATEYYYYYYYYYYCYYYYYYLPLTTYHLLLRLLSGWWVAAIHSGGVQ